MCLVGGLAAVIYTDTLQTFVMIIGALILTVISESHTRHYINHSLLESWFFLQCFDTVGWVKSRKTRPRYDL